MADKAKIILVFVLLVLLFSVLTLIFWDFIRDVIIVPIYYFLWEISLVLKSIPEGIYLALLVFLSVIIGFNTLASLRVERQTKRLERERSESDTRYLHWKSLCANMDVNPFTRDRFAWEARKLILSIFAYEQGIDIADAEMLVQNGNVDVPDTIRNLITEKRMPAAGLHVNRIARAMVWLRRLFFKIEAENDPQIDALVGEIISFIEQRLEINHAGNQPKSWS
jgi:K+-sensing histidine kinase KdpD